MAKWPSSASSGTGGSPCCRPAPCRSSSAVPPARPGSWRGRRHPSSSARGCGRRCSAARRASPPWPRSRSPFCAWSGRTGRRRGIVEHEFAHQLVAALAHAQDVEQFARLQLRDRLRADHAAVGDDTDPADRKTLRNRSTAGSAGHVGVFPGHISVHTGRRRRRAAPPGSSGSSPADVLGEAATPECLTSRALEIEAGGVHEHKVERAEEVTPRANSCSSMTSFSNAAQRALRRLLVFGEFFAEPAMAR